MSDRDVRDRRKLDPGRIKQIQRMAEVASYRRVQREFGVSSKTVAKYKARTSEQRIQEETGTDCV